MRRLLYCVPMISLLLLTGCAGGGGEQKAEELALAVRGEYLAARSCQGTAVLTADYGQRVYRYELNFSEDPEGTTLTLTAPDTVAGITARLPEEGDGVLEYEGTVLETGALDDSGLTPVAAIPAMLRELRQGYLDQAALEDGASGQSLCLRLRDPEREPGEGIETSLWLDSAAGTLLRGEIGLDGFTAIQCEFTTFSKK